MIKIFVYNIKAQRHIGCLHKLPINNRSTHYIADEYGKVLAQGTSEEMEARVEWYENLSYPVYKEDDLEEHY